MASLAAVCRLGARYSAQNASAVGRRVAARDFSSSPRRSAAHNFVMPAMSPTMTEGNIAAWKVKEGDSFSAGDILLEIETDKAQMDIEAQDDGKVAKIITQDGSKSVQVGSRIAVLADPEDDIKTLEIPADNSAAPSAKKESSESTSSSSQQSKQPKDSNETSSRPTTSSSSQKAESQLPSSTSSVQPPNQNYPLYPSVQHLLHTNGISSAEAAKITATGPSGRLLKGDVLAYLGEVKKSHVQEQAERMDKLSQLDLNNIKKAPPKQAPKTSRRKSTDKSLLPELEPDTEIALPVSLAAVFRVQNKINENMGLHLPLSTFIARASEIANENLPRPTGGAVSADDLFNDIIGMHSASRRRRNSRGTFSPKVTALPPPTVAAPPRVPPGMPAKMDVIDLLAGKKPEVPILDAVPDDLGQVQGGAGANNIFSLSVRKGEENRARVYLERVKSVLEAEPGRCVL